MDMEQRKKVQIFALAILLLFISSAQAGVPGYMKKLMGTLEGQLYVNDQVFPNAIVSFFEIKGGPPPLAGSVFRVPDMIVRSNEKGEFSAKLLPGSYYIGTMVLEKVERPRPPGPDDEYFFAADGNGDLRTFEVKTKTVTSFGRVDGKLPGEFITYKNFITIKGMLTDEQGAPVPGMMFNLKESMQSPRPKYTSSERTGEDGAYVLKVPPGKYYVMAMESLRGGRPQPGSYIGTYGKKPPVADAAQAKAGGVGGINGVSPPWLGEKGGGGDALVVEGNNGETISGINITMFRIPDPEATRKKIEEANRSLKPDLDKQPVDEVKNSGE